MTPPSLRTIRKHLDHAETALAEMCPFESVEHLGLAAMALASIPPIGKDDFDRGEIDLKARLRLIGTLIQQGSALLADRSEALFPAAQSYTQSGTPAGRLSAPEIMVEG